MLRGKGAGGAGRRAQAPVRPLEESCRGGFFEIYFAHCCRATLYRKARTLERTLICVGLDLTSRSESDQV